MKKIAVTLLSLALTVSLLSACAGSKKESAPAASAPSSAAPSTANSGKAEEGVTIVLFGPSSWDTFAPGSSEEVVKKVTDQIDKAFMEKYPEVTNIVHDSRGTVSDGLSRLMTAQIAGEQVDLIYAACNPLRTSYQPKGLVVPVDDLVPKVSDYLVEGALTPFTLQGQIWGLPLSGNTATGFFYNKDMFKKYNLPEPKTFNDFAAAAKVFKDNGIIPVLHQGKNPWMWPMWYMQSLPLTTGGKHMEKTISNLKGETKFTDPEDVRAMELVNEYITQGILDKTSLDIDEEGMRAAFIGQKSAAYLGMTGDLPILIENVKDFEVGFFKFPTFPGEPGTSVSYGGIETGLCLSATSEGKSKEYAKLYMEFVLQPENAKITLEPTNPVATSHKDVVGSDNPISKYIREEVLPSEMFLDWVWPRELTTIIQADIQSLVSGAMTPAQVMEHIQKSYDDLVKDGYVYPY